MRQSFYLHFETKPSFAELDALFNQCVFHQPIMATSYCVIFETEGRKMAFFDLVHQCFPRYHYVVMQYGSKNIRRNLETPYGFDEILFPQP